MKLFFLFLGRVGYICFHLLFTLFDKLRRAVVTGYHTKSMKMVGRGVSIDSVDTFAGSQYMTLGDYTCIGRRAVITAWDRIGIPEITIGSHVAIGDDCHITAVNKIVIGDGVLLGKKVTITDNSHGSFNNEDLQIPPLHRRVVSKGPVIIGKNVWLGDKVTVCPGVTIAQGAVVGANSVVTHDIPAFAVVAGVPAHIIRDGSVTKEKII